MRQRWIQSVMMPLRPGGRRSLQLLFLFNLFAFLDINSSLPSKDTNAVTGRRFITQSYKSNPGWMLKVRRFLPLKKGGWGREWLSPRVVCLWEFKLKIRRYKTATVRCELHIHIIHREGVGSHRRENNRNHKDGLNSFFLVNTRLCWNVLQVSNLLACEASDIATMPPTS